MQVGGGGSCGGGRGEYSGMAGELGGSDAGSLSTAWQWREYSAEQAVPVLLEISGVDGMMKLALVALPSDLPLASLKVSLEQVFPDWFCVLEPASDVQPVGDIDGELDLTDPVSSLPLSVGGDVRKLTVWFSSRAFEDPMLRAPGSHRLTRGRRVKVFLQNPLNAHSDPDVLSISTGSQMSGLYSLALQRYGVDGVLRPDQCALRHVRGHGAVPHHGRMRDVLVYSPRLNVELYCPGVFGGGKRARTPSAGASGGAASSGLGVFFGAPRPGPAPISDALVQVGGAAPEPERTPRPTLRQLLKTSFYDILYVLPGFTQAQLRKGYGRASLIHHPDKGGDAECFKFVTMAYEVLRDRAKRAEYDAGNRAKFTACFEASRHVEQPFGMYERIALRSEDLEYILSLRGAGLWTVTSEDGESLNLGTLRTMYTELSAREGGSGRIPVIYHRDSMHCDIGQPGRWYSGCSGSVADLCGAGIDDEFKQCVEAAREKGVDSWRSTASIFEYMPRVVKEVFRLGLCIVDPDQPKCFPRAMIERHPWSVHLRRWCEDRGDNQEVTEK